MLQARGKKCGQCASHWGTMGNIFFVRHQISQVVLHRSTCSSMLQSNTCMSTGVVVEKKKVLFLLLWGRVKDVQTRCYVVLLLYILASSLIVLLFAAHWPQVRQPFFLVKVPIKFCFHYPSLPLQLDICSPPCTPFYVEAVVEKHRAHLLLLRTTSGDTLVGFLRMANCRILVLLSLRMSAFVSSTLHPQRFFEVFCHSWAVGCP